MKKLVLMCALAVSVSAAALAADDIATTTTPPAPVNKSVRDMTDAERAAFWERLPEEEKQRILAKRAQMQGLKTPSTLAVTPPAGTTATVPGTTVPGAAPLPQGNDVNSRIARGKAVWDSMTDDEKRQFITQHKDAIQAATQAKPGGIVTQPAR